MNNLETLGYNLIMSEVRVNHDLSYPWESNISWLFALAEVANAVDGEIYPDFRPSPLHEEGDLTWLVEDSQSHTLLWYRARGDITSDDMRRAFAVLSRYDGWLRLAGKNSTRKPGDVAQ